MIRRGFLLAAAALAVSAFQPAQAASGTVAVLPAKVSRGAAANGQVVTDALRASLQKQGFTVVSAQQVDRAIRGANVPAARPLTVGELADLRARLNADYVVYPRVLTVGQGVNSDEYQANILVNVGGKSAKGFAHTRQVGQVFALKGSAAERAVIGRSEADQAAAKLMEGFYAKAR